MNWIALAKEIGFESVCKLNMEAIVPLDEVRSMCSSDRCRMYGASWACPPGCGSIEICSKRLALFSSGILVQTVSDLEDEFDIEGIALAETKHKKRFSVFARQVRLYKKDSLPLSSGTCTRCEACTYPVNPCRFPDKMFSSMEAYGLLVSDICKKSGIPYYHGEKTTSFTSCILLK